MVGFAPEMGEFGIGQSVKRFEDVRLLRGEGRFHGDVNLPGQAHAVRGALAPRPRAHPRDRRRRRAPGARACSRSSPAPTWRATASAP